MIAGLAGTPKGPRARREGHRQCGFLAFAPGLATILSTVRAFSALRRHGGLNEATAKSGT